MKNWKTWLIIFLFAGLYIDVRLVSPYSDSDEPTICNGPYRQRAFVVQTVVPFRPERETFFFAWGNKHYELMKNIYHYTDMKTGEKIEDVRYSGCAGWDSQGSESMGPHAHLIDLRLLSRPKRQ